MSNKELNYQQNYIDLCNMPPLKTFFNQPRGITSNTYHIFREKLHAKMSESFVNKIQIQIM